MKKLLLVLVALFLAGQAFAETRQVVDDAGRTVEIPVKPQRIIALHEALLALPLIELGLDVVGVYGRADDGGSQIDVDFVKSVFGDDPTLRIAGIGPIGNIDLEKVRALKPDLIVGMGQQQAQIQALSAIAPVYLQATMASSASGFSVEKHLAELLGRRDVFEQKQAGYLARVAAVRDRLPAEARGKTYLAVIVFDQVSAVRDVSGAVQAIRDLGFRPYDWSSRVTSEAGPGRGFAVPLSSEEFARLDPDLLVVMNSYLSPDQSPESIRARTRCDRARLESLHAGGSGRPHHFSQLRRGCHAHHPKRAACVDGFRKMGR